MKWVCAWVAVIVAVACPEASGYKQTTHVIISGRAVHESDLNDPTAGVLKALDLGEHVDDSKRLLPSTSIYSLTLTPMRLIQRGADDEDLGKRSLRHFYDPQQGGAGLSYGVLDFESSLDWALGHSADQEQAFSYVDAKEMLYVGLTGATQAVRDQGLGRTFESLGHVIHHMQDMAQPQHVRNDIHCDEALSQLFESSWIAVPLCPLGFAYRPSAYEDFTLRRATAIPLTGYDVVDFGTFNAPALFWDNGSKGIAAFTSNNFVSAGSIFYALRGSLVTDTRHPRPAADPIVLSKRQITDAVLLGPQGPDQPLSGEIWFVGTPVVDQYRSSSVLNQRTSTYSIFDKELEEAGNLSIYTLNRFNYAAANEFLLPRAAAYSTGLINYFFRGRIGIELPAEGVYGIIDHATTNAAGQGFDKIKLKLSNTSPDGKKPSGEIVPQEMQGGTLVAVAKYTLNSCYTPDLTGDFAVEIATGAVIYPPCSLEQYFAGEEQISQSAAMLAATLEETPSEFTFDFSTQPIPVNARDLRIQVVYTGQLGAEADGIAFGGRDISEPTHLMIYNNSDYYAVDGIFYTPQQIRNDGALSKRVQGLDFDPAALTGVTLAVVRDKPLTDASDPVPVNGYVRAVVLADIDQPFSLNVRSGFERGGSIDSTFAGIWANTTDLRGEQAFITPLAIYRRPRTHFVDVVFKANNAVSLGDNALTEMSARDAGDPGPTRIPVLY